MSGAVSALAALGPVARAIEAVSNLFKGVLQDKADEMQREAGATAAAAETMQDTLEIADAQARVNSAHSDARSIARQLRAEADAADRGGAGAGKPADRAKG